MPIEYLLRKLGSSFRFGIMLWGRLTFWSSFNSVEVHGEVDVSEDKSILYISNHLSYLDIPVLFGWVDNRATFIARKSLSKIPFFGTWLKVIECEFLERRPSRKELGTMKRIKNKLKKGYRYFVFPEGTRSKDGKLQRFKRSTRRLIEIENLEIVPIFIKGTNEILPPTEFIFGSAKVEIFIGEKIQASEYDSNEVLDIIHDWMEEIQKKGKLIQINNHYNKPETASSLA
ncbi:MAG: lysophospholipid acyltransferase family protein [Candidatus Zixiibacteriota bacterium]